MYQFTDLKSRVWDVAITVQTVKDVKQLLGVDLLQPKEVMPRLADPIFVCDLLYCVCKHQADKDGVTDVEFGQSLFGDSLLKATENLIDAYADFFPNPDVRKSVRELGAKMKETAARMATAINKRMGKLDKGINQAVEAFEKEIDRELDKALKTALIG